MIRYVVPNQDLDFKGVEHTGNNRIKHVIAVKEIYESTVIEIFKWYFLNSLNLKQINVSCYKTQLLAFSLIKFVLKYLFQSTKCFSTLK
jgi:hypothetical protein